VTEEQAGQLVEVIASACRIMADQGLVEHLLGHISVRAGDERLYLRCRGPREAGLARTTADDIQLLDFDGQGTAEGWSVPAELPIHAEVLRARTEVTAVVHAHPPALVAFSLLDTALLPVYGAYDIPGAGLAADGIPVWPRSALISTRGLAVAMVKALATHPVLVLRGHGLVSVAGGPPREAIAQAVLQAIAVERLARTMLTVLQAGGTPRPIDPDDLAALPDLGSAFTVDTMWRFLERRLADREGRREHRPAS
jgi:ribulose-5-phosphate 4-epimerase/fuculose-1-phosphate aldolase